MDKSATLSKKSQLGKALAYTLNQWDALCYYADDGLAEPDNNAVERALRNICLGKNYIFFGSDHGGERGALLYHLTGTCKLNGIDPQAYLRHILSVLPEWPRIIKWPNFCPQKWISLLINRQYGIAFTLTSVQHMGQHLRGRNNGGGCCRRADPPWVYLRGNGRELQKENVKSGNTTVS